MSFRKKSKSHERFYLLPGQGGKSYHRKQRLLITWAAIVALLGGGFLTVLMWWMSRPKL